MKFYFYALLLLLSFPLMAQESKTIKAKRIKDAPKIDGVLDDAVWNTLPKYGDFNMLEPGIEGDIPEGFETEIQFAYDDKAIYVAGYLYDPDPAAMSNEFRQRDDLSGQADLFYFGLRS